MTTPDFMKTVGFEKTKIGSGDKEVGYQIKESSMGSLVGSVFLCFLVMGLMVVFMVYDVSLEKKTLHRQLRHEEHHAAAKLAKVQLELWSQYRDDVQESHEAASLLKILEKSYGDFQDKFKTSVSDIAKELSMSEDKAAKLADKILHHVADMQQANVVHATHLLDHLVKSGSKAEKLKKRADKHLLKEVEEEEKHIDEDEKAGVEAEESEHRERPKVDPKAPKKAVSKKEQLKEAEEDPLQGVLEGFFATSADFEKEFGGKARATLKDGNPVYEQIKVLQAKIMGPNHPSEEQIGKELEKIDLVSVGAGLGEGRILGVEDIVEELTLVPKIPLKQLRMIEERWRKGKIDSVKVISRLEALHEQGVLPTGWLQGGVDRKEMEEEQEADDEVKEA